MEAVKKSGKARSIGVSNYLKPHLAATLAKATIPPSINQIEIHHFLQQGDLISFQKAFHTANQNIVVAAYTPLTPMIKAPPGPCDTYLGILAQRYAVSEGEIALRWCVEKGVVSITTSRKEERLRDYLRAIAIKLKPNEVSKIAGIKAEKHFPGGLAGKLIF